MSYRKTPLIQIIANVHNGFRVLESMFSLPLRVAHEARSRLKVDMSFPCNRSAATSVLETYSRNSIEDSAMK